MTISNIKAVILGGLQQVWELILDIENYATWRSDLSKYQRWLSYDIYSDSCRAI